MLPNLLLVLFSLLAVIAIISYTCLSLLNLSQQQEDVEHEQLWRYLVNRPDSSLAVKHLKA
jgi:hypothetical protein